MASEQEIMEHARRIIREKVADGDRRLQGELAPDAVLDAEGGVDSLGFVYVLTTLEAEYCAHVPDDEWWDIHTLSDLAHAIAAHQERA
mgnify:CR=1 FL=1